MVDKSIYSTRTH